MSCGMLTEGHPEARPAPPLEELLYERSCNTSCESDNLTLRVSVSELLLCSSFPGSHLAACADLSSFPRLQSGLHFSPPGLVADSVTAPPGTGSRETGLWQVEWTAAASHLQEKLARSTSGRESAPTTCSPSVGGTCSFPE